MLVAGVFRTAHWGRTAQDNAEKGERGGVKKGRGAQSESKNE